MSILTLRNLSVSHGGPPLLDDAEFTLAAGERVCIYGRNGAGKTTMLQVIAGEVEPDRGAVEVRGAGVAYLPQAVPPDLVGTIFEVVSGGLGEVGALTARYAEASARLAERPDDAALLAALDAEQRALEAAGGWQALGDVERVLSRMRLDGTARVEELSAGMKRRVLLGRAIVSGADVLLLDEPTNHLDVDAIEWLESFLTQFEGAILFVTHDRVFLDRVATRIVELDRGRLFSYDGSYAKFLERREDRLDAEAKQRAEFDKKLAQEEVWIRQGVKERRTRNQGRVRALMEMRKERRARRDLVGSATGAVQEASRSGRLVIEAKGLSFAFDGRDIFRDLDLRIMRGEKVGIIGRNGCGKTTLIRTLLGELAPSSGDLRHGTNLEIAYFDQLHAKLDPSKSVIDNVADGNDRIDIGGTTRHAIGYLQDFLFPPDRARSPVAHLSGGERNRLLLAKLFARPSNVLVLDEPTNDLDTETLELLEARLLDYAGAVLVVSHDRALLNNVVTSILSFESAGEGEDPVVKEYVGGYDDWVRQRTEAQAPATKAEPTKRAQKKSGATAGATEADPAKKKLTYMEQKELEALPDKIESLESERGALHESMSDPAFYEKPRDAVAAAQRDLERIEGELREAYARWESLEERA